MGETLYRRPEILFRWRRLCFDTESPGEISYQSRGDSVSGDTLFRDTGKPAAKIAARVCCWFAEAFDLGILFGVEPCADVMVSATARHRSQNIGARRRDRGGDGERILTWRILTLGFCPV